MLQTLPLLDAGQDKQAMVDMACDLVNFPSPTGEEGPIAEYIARRFAELGMQVQMQEVEPDRPNVIAHLKGAGEGPTLLLLAHMDTSTEPDPNLPMGFQAKATVVDGWIYGLGISNMKCAFAGFYSALQILRDADIRLKGEVVMAGVVGEIEKAPIDEWQGRRFRGGGLGARFMLNHGVTADFCINGEPTALRLQTGNAGYAFVRIQVRGSAQATYSKHAAVDPLPKAFRLHAAIQEWEPLYQQRHAHPLMKPLVNVGGIYGGFPFKPSITAPFCNLYLHVNLVPGQSILGVQREVEEVVTRVKAEDPELDASVEIYLASNGHELPMEHPVAQAVASAHEQLFGTPVTRPNPERYSVSSDNSPLAEFGIPGVTYGAGGISRAGHYAMYEPGVGELVGIENLAACARVYAMAIADLCGAV